MVQGMSKNNITGDTLVSKPSTTYADNYDRIWGKKPSCLDAAYERRAIEQGMNSNPVFDENKRGRCIIHDNERVDND